MAPTGPPRANSDPSQPGIRSFTGAWGGLAGAEPGPQISQGRKSTCETVGRPSSSYRGRAEPSPIRARLALLARHRDQRRRRQSHRPRRAGPGRSPGVPVRLEHEGERTVTPVDRARGDATARLPHPADVQLRAEVREQSPRVPAVVGDEDLAVT